jgi:two-component system cell cycle sensor histidine kinase/response regulator CckA
VTVDLDLRAAFPQVYADPFRLQQALMHLVDNACEAMPHGGSLRIASSEMTFDGYAYQPPDAIVGMYVCVVVIDTGVGVDYRIRDNVVESFFTPSPNGVDIMRPSMRYCAQWRRSLPHQASIS